MSFLADVRRAHRLVACYVCDVLEVAPSEKARCIHVSGGIVDAHHLVAKQQLKRDFRRVLTEVELEALLRDPRNGIPVRRYHHDALEHKRIVIPWERLPPAAQDFARGHLYAYDEERGIFRRQSDEGWVADALDLGAERA